MLEADIVNRQNLIASINRPTPVSDTRWLHALHQNLIPPLAGLIQRELDADRRARRLFYLDE